MILELGIEAVERGMVPDVATRVAIRRLCRRTIRMPQAKPEPAFLKSLRQGPVALSPDAANAQHYELPPEFFATVLGPHRKYSCCYFPDSTTSLADAEIAALKITCEHAALEDGQEVLELGCGWGSLTLWMAEHYRNSRILAVSNSHLQRKFIAAEAERRGLRNVQLMTADMNDFSPGARRFDRVVSVEMFEHMRNYQELLAQTARWLHPQGKLFVHLFCHRNLLYPFPTEGAANWMGRYFFTGGMMPSADLLLQFQDDLRVIQRFTWQGGHYQRTAEAWLANLDARREEALVSLRQCYGAQDAHRWLQRWRVFFLSVAELFGMRQGEEWFVSHYLLERVNVSS